MALKTEEKSQEKNNTTEIDRADTQSQVLVWKNEEDGRLSSTDGKRKRQQQMLLGVMGTLSHPSMAPSLCPLISQ